jgi:UDP-GlcNAc:undecaprenyl-phosphate GlcNAc-1-phosphate transferase
MFIGLIAFILSSFLIFISNKRFLSKNLIDKINLRSSHSKVATRSGGISIFLTLLLISLYFYFVGYEIYDFSLLIPLSLLLVVGLYDDIYMLDFKLKFIFQIIAAKIIIDNGFIIENLYGFMGIFELGRFVSQIITIIIIVAIVNAINFIDGIDGLAISCFILFISAFEFFSLNTSPFHLFSILLISILLPFYYFNFRKENKVFLGDSGSLFLGGVISIYVIYILSNSYSIKLNYDLHKLIFVISILSYPIFDIVRVFIMRLWNGKSPFLPDKKHIHHLILKKTKSHFYTVAIIILVSIMFLFSIQYINYWI